MQTLTKSHEKYLTTIFQLSREKEKVRLKDVVQKMALAPSTVSEAIKMLAGKDLIKHSPYEPISLTDEGYNIASELVKKHDVLFDFFSRVLSMQEDEANTFVSGMENAVNTQLLDRFVFFLDFMQKCSCKNPKWLEAFKYYAEHNALADGCSECMTSSNATCCGNQKTSSEK